MKNLILSLGLIALVVLVGCSDATTNTSPAKDSGTPMWNSGPGVATDYSGPVLNHKKGDFILDMPLAVLTCDEIPFQQVDGLSYGGASYTYTVGGSSSSDCNYNAGGPSAGDYVQPPVIEGGTGGVLTITFDAPTTIAEFGININHTGTETGAVKVDVYGPNNKLRSSTLLDVAPSPLFAGALFAYDGNAAKKVVISFDTFASRFAVDNITFHPEE